MVGCHSNNWVKSAELRAHWVSWRVASRQLRRLALPEIGCWGCSGAPVEGTAPLPALCAAPLSVTWVTGQQGQGALISLEGALPGTGLCHLHPNYSTAYPRLVR